VSGRPPTPGTKTLAVAIIAGFVIEILTGAWLNPEILREIGAIVPAKVWWEHEYWRLFTAMFLHGDGTIPGDVLHLGMNLFALFQLGTLYELMFGSRRFLVIYFVSGLVASITSALHMPAFGASVGASGAVFGILGAFVFSVRRSPRFRNNRTARSIVAQCVFWAIANVVIGLQIEQIDNAAHIGGLVAGLILGAILPHYEPPPPPAQMVVDVTPYGGPGASPGARTDDR
jgi:rhomboid protease GluP